MSFYLGLAIILTVVIIAVALYALIVGRNTYSIEDLLYPPWDDTNASNAKTVASGAKRQSRAVKTRKKPVSSASKSTKGASK